MLVMWWIQAAHCPPCPDSLGSVRKKKCLNIMNSNVQNTCDPFFDILWKQQWEHSMCCYMKKKPFKDRISSYISWAYTGIICLTANGYQYKDCYFVCYVPSIFFWSVEVNTNLSECTDNTYPYFTASPLLFKFKAWKRDVIPNYTALVKQVSCSKCNKSSTGYSLNV